VEAVDLVLLVLKTSTETYFHPPLVVPVIRRQRRDLVEVKVHDAPSGDWGLPLRDREQGPQHVLGVLHPDVCVPT